MPARRRKTTTRASATSKRKPKAAARKKVSTTRARRAVPKKTHDQLRKALWRKKRLLKGLCADCGAHKRLRGITRCAGCALKKRKLNRVIRECGTWKKGGQGAPPAYTDKQLRELVKKRKKG